VLKQRILTALVLLPLMIGAIFWLEGRWFAVAMAVPVLAASWEWANLMNVRGRPEGWLFIASTAFLMLVTAVLDLDWIVFPAALWWIVAFWVVRRYPDGAEAWTGIRKMWVIGLLVLVPAWQGLCWLHEQPHGVVWLLYAMCLVWGADTGAYFAGRRFGKRKLAPAVSPGKTLEGLAGGVLLTSVLAVIVCMIFPAARDIGIAAFLAISTVTVFASVLGDLFESMAKRHRGIKDSSQLLPGHGGVLDRIDSVTAAIPVFVAGMMLLQG
jgi:phosphatidate cytidylyltransferase